MSDCDMCGREGPIQKAVVEGSLLSICTKCSTYGKVVPIPAIPSNKMVSVQSRVRSEEAKEIVVENYAELIKKARERLKLKQEELAAHIQEKVSVIHKLESGQFSPPLALAKKLGRYLQIQLLENYTRKAKTKVNLQDKDLTIGDLINIKKTK